uniref:protein tyrosine phosphatase domain-containing protein 1 isoform X2 n=1 Tax=Ciona intestinalis TaxID=7719 RepID=UPI00089DCC0D|nr:protein tyrosine phosphatase domain-containing protein 1 isoform X2 [Ciona intestinalis]|eukprot:XP_018668379.1 protein tyrosine phosphatase domain-containing protein 1 isoform X2 [Ciona intestinalis]
MEKRRVNNGSLEEGVAEAKYTRFGERIRQVFPGPMQCSMACGGKNCKWENPSRWSDADQAIKGVFSSWVLDNVVAMSRPSTQIIEKYNIIDQFKRHNITSIINLQRPGEHASCGPPLDKESLFTYKPQLFMDNDIFFYNFGWKDFGVTSLNTILDMVKVMCFALEEGNVAVHCHAGLGRTGVLIACYLVFAHRMDPDAAILRVRKNRSNSIQTRGQIACIHEFAQFLRPLRIVFPQVVPHSKRLTLKQFLTRQHHLLHGFESRELKHTPKLVHTVCLRLSQIAVAGDSVEDNVTEEDAVKDDAQIRRCNTVAEIKETIPGAFVNENMAETATKEEKQVPLSKSPTDVDAVLSPRVSRRSSARTNSTSEAVARPQSAGDPSIEQTEDEIFANTSDEQEWKKKRHVASATSKPPTPILVASRNRALSAKSHHEDDDDVSDESSEPKVMLVRQGSCSGGINLTEGVIYSSEESGIHSSEQEEMNDSLTSCNINNNHSLNESSFASINLDIDEDANIDLDETAPTSEQSDPKPSIQPSTNLNERGVNSLIISINKMAAIESTILAEIEGQPSVRKPRLSAGRSDTILPTGLPSKSLRNSAKSRLPVTEESADNDVAEKSKDEDDNLDEIIDIKEDEGPSFSDTENEDDVNRDKLSNSIASKVSWTQQMNNTNSKEARDLSASSKASHSGRRTPLMYRAERNIDLFNKMNEQTQEDDSKSDSSGNNSDVIKESEPPILPEESLTETDADLLGSDLHPPIPRINSTKSMSDLPQEAKKSPEFLTSRFSSFNDADVKNKEKGSNKGPISVAKAFAYKLTDDEFLWERVYTHQIEINNRIDAWATVSNNCDAFVLSALMWSWVEHLAEPVITQRSKMKMLELVKINEDATFDDIVMNFESALKALEPEVSCTTKCLLNCILSFPAFPKYLAHSVVDRTISALTQSPLNPNADAENINHELTQVFQAYVDAKYELANKVQFHVGGETPNVVASKEIVETISLDNENDEIEPENDIILSSEPTSIAPRSASSIRSSSSGGSNTSVILMQSSIACS